MNKKAYNLAEMVMVIAIIGFIVMLLFNTINPSYKAVPLAYSRVFTSLEDAIYNSYEKIKQKNTLFPGEGQNPDPFQSAQQLCKLIAASPFEDEESSGYINTVVYNCGENFQTVPEYIRSNTFNESNMAFQATNSMKFYISPLQQVKIKNAVSEKQIVAIRYFIVWVDLNGKKRPNSAFINKKGIIDIVPFIVTTRGNVLPAGYPTTDMRYFSAYVQYPLDNTPMSSQSRTYYDAQTAAFNGREYPFYDVFSIRDSILRQHQGTALEIKSFSPQSSTYDKPCKIKKSTDEPLCKVEINDRF